MVGLNLSDPPELFKVDRKIKLLNRIIDLYADTPLDPKHEFVEMLKLLNPADHRRLKEKLNTTIHKADGKNILQALRDRNIGELKSVLRWFTKFTMIINDEKVVVDPINHKNKRGETFLHILAKFPNNLEKIKLVFGAGAELNSRDVDGSTVLHDAVISENVSYVKFLLSKNIDYNIRINHENPKLRQTALDMAKADA